MQALCLCHAYLAWQLTSVNTATAHVYEDDLVHCEVILIGHHDIRWRHITMAPALLMKLLHCLYDNQTDQCWLARLVAISNAAMNDQHCMMVAIANQCCVP